VGLEGLEWLRKALFDKYLFDQEEEQQIRVKIGLQDTKRTETFIEDRRTMDRWMYFLGW
jgi:hypothetical protein